MRYDLVIFDLDGTILDTLEDLRDALNHSLAAYGYRERTLQDVRRFIGSGIKKLIERAVPEGTPATDIEKIYAEFIPYYQAHCADRTRPYAGITELINALKARGYQTAVVSNKADPAVQKLCDIFFRGLFAHVAGQKEGIPKKPAPDSVLAAIKALGGGNAVYIGDSDVDIETAKNAGLDCISVTWGFRDRDFLARHGASVFADKVEDISHLL